MRNLMHYHPDDFERIAPQRVNLNHAAGVQFCPPEKISLFP